MPGFEVVGTCLGGHEAIERFDELTSAGNPADIVLLDMNLTDSHGLEVAGRLNSRGQDVDIIAITAVRHLQVIRSAISSGITQYLIKPFTFAVFREKLENQREFRRGLRDRDVGDSGLGGQCALSPAVGIVDDPAEGADRRDLGRGVRVRPGLSSSGLRHRGGASA